MAVILKFPNIVHRESIRKKFSTWTKRRERTNIEQKIVYYYINKY